MPALLMLTLIRARESRHRRDSTRLRRRAGAARFDGRRGRRAVPSCDYTITGQTPPARLWTVSLENRDGQAVKERDTVAALGSDTLLREDDGSFRITLSSRPQTGNWISTEEAGRFRIAIRLYDTTARTGTELTTLVMPRIARERCT